MLYETLKLALQAISRNAMRSFLTVLGIIIGVGAVIAMVTIGNGTTAKVNADLAKLGSNMLFVRPGQFGPGRASAEAPSFDARDIEAIRTQVSGLKAVSPSSSATATIVYGSETPPPQDTTQTRNHDTTQEHNHRTKNQQQQHNKQTNKHTNKQTNTQQTTNNT